jgi:drug/metabolite transporter (DMT)-like permease
MNVAGRSAAAAAGVLYGSAYVAISVALDGFTPVGVAVVRGALGATVLVAAMSLPGLAKQRPARMEAAALARLGLIALFGGGIFVLAMNAAVALSGATVTAFVAGLYAVVAAVLGIPLLGERLKVQTVLALLAALAGTLLLSDLLTGAGSSGGIGMALVAAASFGLFLVLSRRWSVPFGLSGLTIGLASLAASGVVAIAVAVVVGDRIAREAVPLDAAIAAAWVAVGPGAAASVLVVIGMRRLPAPQASLMLLLNPPTAAVLAYVVLGERLDGLRLAGAALILAAIGVASGAISTKTASRRSSQPGSAPQSRS